MQKKNKNAGVAMVVVLIVGAVVMVFCLSLLFAAYTLFSQTNRQVTQEQCKILAQSTSEALAAELKKPDSELVVYMGAQIQSGKWISEEVAEAAEPGTLGTDVVSELVMTLNDNDQSGDYNVSVTFSYSMNLPDDDGGDEDDEKDDQDDNPEADDENVDTGGAGNQANTNQTSSKTDIESGEASAGNGSYTVRASVRCTRGDGTGSDVQYYEIETVFPSVMLKGGTGDEKE